MGACTVNIIGNTIMVPFIGGRGAAISTGISYIVFFALRTILSNKYYKVDFQIWKISIVTILTFAYALFNTFVKFNVITIVGFIVCVAVLLVLYHSDFVSCIQFAMKTVKSRINKRIGES